MSKLMLAAIKLYHAKESSHIKAVMNHAVNGATMPSNPKVTGTQVWFWAIKRWGKDFSIKEYEIREGL